MALLLNVPFSDKNQAKYMGAKWNPQLKKWYVNNKKEYPKFRKWFEKDNYEFAVICDYIYIVEGKRQCYKCGNETRVIGFGIENFYEIADEEDLEGGYEYYDEEILISSEIDPMPPELMTYITTIYNYRSTYSKTIKTAYNANVCDYCGALQGKNYLFHEVESPFWIEDGAGASMLTLYKIGLKYDLIISEMEVGWGGGNHLLKKYGRIIHTKLIV